MPNTVSKLLLAFIVAPFPYSSWGRTRRPSRSLLLLFFYGYRRTGLRNHSRQLSLQGGR
jgi:hypothetical protein